jgi:hypothetical protein
LYIKQPYCIIILLFISPISKAQKPREIFPLIAEMYNKWKAHHLTIPKTACDTFFYADAVSPGVLGGIKDWLNENSTVAKRIRLDAFRWADTTNAEKIIFTRTEKDSIALLLDFVKQLPWPDSLFNISKMVAQEAINDLLNRVEKSKDSLLQKLCLKIHLFSVPIVFRNNTLCLIYRAEADILSHFGELWLYRKEDNQWKEFGPVANWWLR